MTTRTETMTPLRLGCWAAYLSGAVAAIGLLTVLYLPTLLVGLGLLLGWS